MAVVLCQVSRQVTASKIEGHNRDKYFDRSWSTVIIELEGGEPAEVQLSQSFWHRCSELRSAEIGRWLLTAGAAPWPTGSPPRIAVLQIEGNRFAARLLPRRSLGSVVR